MQVETPRRRGYHHLVCRMPRVSEPSPVRGRVTLAPDVTRPLTGLDSPIRLAMQRLTGSSRVRTMKSLGEIEAGICEGISRFEQEYMGRGPKSIHAHVLGDFLVVRLQGVLTAAEQQLAKSLPAEKGRDLLKQVRTHLIETARPLMEAMVEEVSGVKVVSLHHDISTATGEEVVVFTLAEPPSFRETRETRRK
jgi:uncharacterized protein YbcI